VVGGVVGDVLPAPLTAGALEDDRRCHAGEVARDGRLAALQADGPDLELEGCHAPVGAHAENPGATSAASATASAASTRGRRMRARLAEALDGAQRFPVVAALRTQ